MPDPRINKLAEILVNYSLEIKPGDQFQIRTNPLGQELALSVFEEAVRAGAHVLNTISLPGSENESAIHWDMLCDMSQSEIKIDGEPFYQDGKFIV